MSTLLQIAIATAALWIGSWLIMILLAKRLPPGLLRDATEFLPRLRDDRTPTAPSPGGPAPREGRTAHRHPLGAISDRPAARVPPDHRTVDDVVAVVLLLRYAARAIPRDMLLAAWPAKPRLLERLLPTVS